MKAERSGRGLLFHWIIVMFVTAWVIASVVSATTIEAPTTVTRGGVADEGEDPVLGSFNVTISNGSGTLDPLYYLGFTINPQNMTGGYCDRPPYFNNSTTDYLHFEIPDDGSDRSIGETTVIGEEFYGASFYKLVPNGVDYPADRPDLVYKNGTRYYGRLAYSTGIPDDVTNFTVVVNTTYPPGFVGGSMSLKPGTYNLHAQKPGDGEDDVANVPIQVVYGTVDLSITQKYENLYTVSGHNTDSKYTYLWLTGEGLPECGTNLTFGYAQPVSGSYTLIGNTTLTGISPVYDGFSRYRYYANGTWSFDWYVPPTMKMGTYKVWASSVNPRDVEDLPDTNWTSTTGVCGLQCDICSPEAASAEFTIERYNISVPSIQNSTIFLDCCNQSVCSACPGYPKMIMTGDLRVKSRNGNGFPIQVWIFGDSLIGDKPVIFDTFTSFPDGTYEIDLTRMLTENRVLFCDLENGNYTVLVQAEGMDNGKRHPVFDITHERTITSDGVPVFDLNHWYVVGSHPYSKYPIGYYSLDLSKFESTINPGYYPLFPIEGPDSLGGKAALDALIEALQGDWVHDRYQIANFTVNNQLCRSGVDFTASPREGYTPLTVQFNDTSSFAGTSWSWDFGDGGSAYIQNPSHPYNASGSYSVRLIVTNDTESKEKNKDGYITVKDMQPVYSVPDANYTYLKVDNEPLAIQYIDQSYGSTPLTYRWTFGDNANSTDKSPMHTYQKAGPYTVNLTVTDQFGKTSLESKQVIVPPVTPPVAKFNYTADTENPRHIKFTDLSTGEPYTWHWDFGDETTSSLNSPNHTYATYGRFPVTLTVSNQAGINTTYSSVMLTGPGEPIKAGFTVSRIDSRVFAITNASSGPVLSSTLSFGDGSEDETFDGDWVAYHTFERFGNFPVTLTVTNGEYTDTYTKYIFVV